MGSTLAYHGTSNGAQRALPLNSPSPPPGQSALWLLNLEMQARTSMQLVPPTSEIHGAGPTESIPAVASMIVTLNCPTWVTL